MRRAPSISLTPLERAWLEAWAGLRPPAGRLSLRARVVLGASEGWPNSEIARKLGIHPETVGRWRRRFAVHRLEGVRRDAPRSGGRWGMSRRVIERTVRLAATRPGPNGARWSTRTLARLLGINHMAVHRIWKARDLAGADPTVRVGRTVPGGRVRIDLLGLYVGAPATAIVFGVRTPTWEQRGARTLPPYWISGRYAGNVGPHLPPPLAGFLLDIEAGRSPICRPPGAAHGILVFLRTLEEEPGLSSAALHVIFDRPLDRLPERLVGWLGSHARFRPTGPAPGSTWTGAVDEWVRAFSGTVVDPDSLRDMGSLLESSAVAGPDLPQGFSWTHGGSSGEPPAPSPATSNARALPAGPESA